MSAFAARKRRKLSHTPETSSTTVENHQAIAESHTFPRGASTEADAIATEADEVKNGESLTQLRRMVFGEIEHAASHKQYVVRSAALVYGIPPS